MAEPLQELGEVVFAGSRRTLRDLATDFSLPTELFAVVGCANTDSRCSHFSLSAESEKNSLYSELSTFVITG
ncbi:hypothetical protein GS682_08990 [Nostoc sp. B(2019)]|nr:hypothetical protein [Nostoc sp. B(2019)]